MEWVYFDKTFKLCSFQQFGGSLPFFGKFWLLSASLDQGSFFMIKF